MQMQAQTLQARLAKLAEKILEMKVIKIAIGRNKRPIDKQNEIIFHIDI